MSYPIYTSTGIDFQNAGYGLKNDNGWDGYKIINNSPLLEGTSLLPGAVLRCPSDETDGAPVLITENGTPIIDYKKMPFFKVEIVGYDLVRRGEKDGLATWIIFKAIKSSGTVINTASTNWCSSNGIGSNPDIQKITTAIIKKLMNNESIFSPEINSSFSIESF